MVQPDFKPPKRIKGKELFRELHGKWRCCALCGSTENLSLHHIIRRSQGGDDVEANLVMLDGSGTTGCHGAVEGRDGPTLHALATYLLNKRPDTLAYLVGKMGPAAASDWFKRQMT